MWFCVTLGLCGRYFCFSNVKYVLITNIIQIHKRDAKAIILTILHSVWNSMVKWKILTPIIAQHQPKINSFDETMNIFVVNCHTDVSNFDADIEQKSYAIKLKLLNGWKMERFLEMNHLDFAIY